MHLQQLGFPASFQDAFSSLQDPRLRPARVIRADKGQYTVVIDSGVTRAILRGRLIRSLATHELPATGDFVAVLPLPGEDKVVIEHVLPRQSAFLRKRAGDTTEAQVVAANVDVVLLIMGLDADFNPRRLERYLALARDSGAEPVVVLNKLDLADDPDAQRAEVDRVAGKTPVLVMSATLGVGIDELQPHLGVGRTLALLGSSGVGKSTLINALVGEERLRTGAVRAGDGRGQHTTTYRELMPLPGGGAVMDTPGMRELQLWGDEETVDLSFPDVVALAATCRFPDCAHGAEPGCAVRAAIDDGTLPAERLASYQRLQDEMATLRLRQDEQHEKRRKELKAFGRMVKDIKAHKRRW